MVKPYIKMIASTLLAAHLLGGGPEHSHPLIERPLPAATAQTDGEHSPHSPEEFAPDDLPNTEAVPVRMTGRIVEIRTGSAPMSENSLDNGTILATLIAYTRYPTHGSPTVWAEGTADSSGTAGHFIVKDESGKTVYQGNITSSREGGDLIFDNPTIVTGGTVVIEYQFSPESEGIDEENA
jgi:hypothetical protein